MSLDKMTSGQESYYAQLAREDYYLEGGEPPGQWRGRGAESLALFGQIDGKNLSELFQGRLDGRALVQNAGSSKRTPGWDCTFSPPKSVSVAWSQASGAVGKEIQAAHKVAVDKAIDYLEGVAGFTRRGKGGCEREKCALVFATYEHGTSRSQEPQLHTHALLLNVGVRADGTTGTLSTNQLYANKMTAGALYRAELTSQLEQRLGLRSVKDGWKFRLEGVSQELCEHFSTRRAEIEAQLKKQGSSGAVASERAALTTRRNKDSLSWSELMPRWQKAGQEHGWSWDQLQGLLRGPQKPDAEQAKIAARLSALTAFEKLTTHQTTFTEAQLTRFAAEQAQDTAAGIDEVVAGVKFMLADRAVVKLGQVDGQERYTSTEILSIEANMLTRAERLKDQRSGTAVQDRHLKNAITKKKTLTPEQAEAVQFITTKTNRVAVVVGDAGTGKTFTMDAARLAWEASGQRVIGAALAGKAARGLQEGAGIESRTIASLLMRLEWERERQNQGHAVRSVLDDKTVLVVDEAGMVGTRQMERLLQEVSQAGSKIVLVGDQKQLQAIEFGGAFAALASTLGSYRISEVMRQKDPEHVQAIGEIAAGRARRSLDYYAAKGQLSVSRDRDQARGAMLARWKEAGGVYRPQDHLMMAGRNVDVAILNRQAQEDRYNQGTLSVRSVKVGAERFRVGERIVFTKNSREHDVSNGQFGRVESIEGSRVTVRVEGQEGKEATRKIDLRQYDDMKLGYAVTTHKAQGMTTEFGYVLTDETMQDRELSYVQVSRAKQATRLFTTESEAGEDLSDLARSMERTRQEELATVQKERADEQPAQKHRARLGW